ncbi:MAG: hypothetical protein Q9187_008972 [Circinaria calcarea]
MPANSAVPNPSLNLPETITDIDIPPMLDESIFNMQPRDLDFGLQDNDNDPLNWTSQVFSDPISIERGRGGEEDQPMLYDDDLGLDIDFTDGPSIEKGRDAPPARSVADDLIGDDDKFQGENDLDLDFGDNGPLPRTRYSTEAPTIHQNEGLASGNEDPMDIENPDNFAFDVNDTTIPSIAPADPRLQRDSQSPLSSVRSSVVREFDETIHSEEPSVHQARQPASKKRKLLPLDLETTLHSNQIKKQQADRSAILKPISFLPRDPVLLTLMNMQQNGGFVSNIMGDGRTKGWAPELRGILSIEVVRKSGALKRKRDSGVADVEEEEEPIQQNDMPQLEIPEDEELLVPDEGIDMVDNNFRREASTLIDLPADEGLPPPTDFEDIPETRQNQPLSDEEAQSPLRDNFEDTTVPLIHPIDQGPISLGTRHAVHLLRDRFASTSSATAESTPSQQSKANVLFQELLPEARTTKADATKMFFEVLVLATKDAVKVEQAEADGNAAAA